MTGTEVGEMVSRAWTERRYGVDGDQTLVTRFEEALSRFAYVVALPGVSILSWLTDSDPRRIGLVTAQIAGLTVAGTAALRLTANVGVESPAASVIGLAGFATAALVIPTFRELEGGERQPEAVRVLLLLRSLFALVAVVTLLTGHGPRIGAFVTYLVACGIGMHFAQPASGSFRSWMKAAISSSDHGG